MQLADTFRCWEGAVGCMLARVHHSPVPAFLGLLFSHCDQVSCILSLFHSAPGVYDSSGIRLYYTARLRKYDMGVLQLGFFTFPIHFIPPGAESFLSYGLCKTEKFEEVKLGGTSSLRFLVSQHRFELVPKHTHPEPGTWRITIPWCPGKPLTWIMQGKEGVGALGTGGWGRRGSSRAQ